MSKASELAELASTINVTPSGGAVGADAVAIDSVSIKKLIVTDGRAGNTEFDGGNTAYPAIELLSSGMGLASKYTPAIKFGSTDAQFITQNPKFGAAIVAEATQNYTIDTTGGMALSFWTSPINPGAATSLRERMTIEASGQITVNNSGFLAWTNANFEFATAGDGQGSRMGKWIDNNFYIDNYDSGDILFRNEARPAGDMMRMHGANGNVSIVNDLLFNSGFGSAAKAFGCRAWANFNGTGTVAIRNSGNVSSITDVAIGRYRVNFISPMPDANYSAAPTSSATATSSYPTPYINEFTVNYVGVVIGRNSTADDDASFVTVTIFR